MTYKNHIERLVKDQRVVFQVLTLYLDRNIGSIGGENLTGAGKGLLTGIDACESKRPLSHSRSIKDINQGHRSRGRSASDVENAKRGLLMDVRTRKKTMNGKRNLRIRDAVVIKQVSPEGRILIHVSGPR